MKENICHTGHKAGRRELNTEIKTKSFFLKTNTYQHKYLRWKSVRGKNKAFKMYLIEQKKRKFLLRKSN